MTSTIQMPFTYRARKVMAWACHHAQRTNSEHIHPEHLARGIVNERECFAARLLEKGGIDLEELKEQLEALFEPRGSTESPKVLPRSPATQSVIEAAIEECKGLQHNSVGTEHYLLGFLRNPDVPASQLLIRRGLDLGTMRGEIGKWAEKWSEAI